ncbi:MAG: MATE family efflux transporter [Oscillospiraceae bacterium]|jgi:putative MATE family efflux protein|nr:MATE family efflux transporter [Oscillospiraceae bacterium]
MKQESTTHLAEKQTHMLEQPVSMLVLRLSLPCMASMLISALYNMADTYFVSSLGTSATAAIGIVFSLMNIIQAVGFFFGHGSGNYMSRQLGAGDFAGARQMASMSLGLSLTVGMLISVSGLVFLDPLVNALGATVTIAPFAKDYMRWILIGAPFMTGSFTLNNQLRYEGNAAYGMVGMVSGAVLNTALDPLLIFVFRMGTSGAGISTMLSQALGFCILLHGTTRKGAVKISIKDMKPTARLVKELFRGGTPSLFRQGLAGFTAAALNRTAAGFGDAAVAAISIVQRFTMLVYSCVLGFGQAFQPVCGFNYGAKRYSRVRKAFWFCVKLSTLVLVCLAALGAVFAPQIVQFFNKEDNPLVSEIGTAYLRYCCITIPLFGFFIITNMCTQTIGDAVKASFLAIARQGVFMIPLLFILPRLLGLRGLEMIQMSSDILSCLCGFIIGILTDRKMKRLAAEAELIITNNSQKTMKNDENACNLSQDVIK